MHGCLLGMMSRGGLVVDCVGWRWSDECEEIDRIMAGYFAAFIRYNGQDS
jgi:hypothetical protein